MTHLRNVTPPVWAWPLTGAIALLMALVIWDLSAPESVLAQTYPRVFVYGDGPSGPVPIALNASGALSTTGGASALVDHCDSPDKTYVRFNHSTTTPLELIDATADEVSHLCQFHLQSQGTVSVAIVQDDTDQCPSPTTGLFGAGTTAATGWSFEAREGIVLGSGGYSIEEGDANRNVCMLLSTTVEVTGYLSFVNEDVS